jgi:hypothetical protein
MGTEARGASNAKAKGELGWDATPSEVAHGVPGGLLRPHRGRRGAPSRAFHPDRARLDSVRGELPRRGKVIASHGLICPLIEAVKELDRCLEARVPRVRRESEVPGGSLRRLAMQPGPGWRRAFPRAGLPGHLCANGRQP